MSKKISINCENIYQTIYEKDKKKLMKFMGQGASGSAFLICLDDFCKDKVVIKISLISKYYKYNKSHPTLVDYLIGKKISELVNQNITPHINEVYTQFLCDINTLKQINEIIMNKKISSLLENEKHFMKKYYNQFVIIFNKYAQGDFYQYLKNYKITKIEHLSFLFMVCYTLTCIVYHNEGYRHNDLKPNNILININKNFNTNNLIEYKIFGKKYYLPELPITLKIHDFDFSFTNEIRNKKIGKLKQFIHEETNPVYDIHYLINHLITILKLNNADLNIINMFTELLPDNTIGYNNEYTIKYRLTNYKKNIIDTNYNYIPKDLKSPAEMILLYKNFNIFKKKNIDFKNKKIIKKYDSQIPNEETNNILTRKDLFNVLL